MDTPPREKIQAEGQKDLVCKTCNQPFRDAYNLRRHLLRQTTCAPITGLTGQGNECRYCGKAFATRPSMNRHVRQYCKIANSDEGMEQLMDFTLQRQMASQAQKVDALQTQVAELTSLLRQQLIPQAPSAVVPAPAASPAPTVVNAQTATVNTAPVQHNTHIVQNITIAPWDGESRIRVQPAEIVAAFAENARLREYTGYSDYDLADHKIASPYVTELLMDLVKRSHADPAARNVYLNPRRADQVLAHMRSGQWEVLPLAEATRLLFDGVAETIHRTVLSDAERRRLPLEAQNALAIAGMLYEEKPDEYVHQAKAPMSAHLTNLAPRDAV